MEFVDVCSVYSLTAVASNIVTRPLAQCYSLNREVECSNITADSLCWHLIPRAKITINNCIMPFLQSMVLIRAGGGGNSTHCTHTDNIYFLKKKFEFKCFSFRNTKFGTFTNELKCNWTGALWLNQQKTHMCCKMAPVVYHCYPPGSFRLLKALSSLKYTYNLGEDDQVLR